MAGTTVAPRPERLRDGPDGDRPGKTAARRPDAARAVTAIAFALLALRLAASVLLLPPWAGFDEPFHQGYAEADAVRLRWPGLREIDLPAPLIDAMRRWPLPRSYAADFGARAYGQSRVPPSVQRRSANHETQQSPLYYWITGLLLRLAGRGDPLRDLYLLRAANAALSLAVGWLLWKAARSRRLAGVPVALLALIPGFGFENCRVANDPLCGFLIGLAVVGAVSVAPAGWWPTIGSLAAGLAPWSKLYGLTVAPWSAVRESLRRGEPFRARATRGALILGPAAVLLACSVVRFGHPFPVMYNIRGAPYVSLFAVPWLRDAWAVLKSHVWMSGMDFLVFPTWIYVAPVLLLAWGVGKTVRSAAPSDRQTLAILGATVGTFGLALAYNSWRTFGYFGGGGGSAGWYLWAMAVPEILLVTLGAIRKGVVTLWTVATLSVFLAVTALADAATFLSSTGFLLASPGGHLLGVARCTLGQVIERYAQSRPAAIGLTAVLCAAASWIAAVALLAVLLRVRRIDGRSPALGS